MISNIWSLSTDDRLLSWREFRHELDQLDFEPALKKCVHLWSYVPFVNRHLRPEWPDQWPDPWHLLAENRYCDLAKALGMLYTMYLTRHGDQLSMELRVYDDMTQRYNLVWIDDGKYVLNFYHDEIVNTQHIQKDLVLAFKYTADELGIEKYK